MRTQNHIHTLLYFLNSRRSTKHKLHDTRLVSRKEVYVTLGLEIPGSGNFPQVSLEIFLKSRSRGRRGQISRSHTIFFT